MGFFEGLFPTLHSKERKHMNLRLHSHTTCTKGKVDDFADLSCYQRITQFGTEFTTESTEQKWRVEYPITMKIKLKYENCNLLMLVTCKREQNEQLSSINKRSEVCKITPLAPLVLSRCLVEKCCCFRLPTYLQAYTYEIKKQATLNVKCFVNLQHSTV